MDEIKNKKTCMYFLRCLVVPGLVLLMSCQTVPPVDRSTMTMGFAEAAFGLGIEPKGKHAVVRSDNLRRWKTDEPVHLLIKGEPEGTDLHKKIIQQLRDLYQLASIDLKISKGLARQLLRVKVSDEPFLTDPIIAQCYTDFDYVFQGYLKTIDIVVTRTSMSDDDSSCLLHEGMHSLGFGGHPHRLNSVLSYTETVQQLSMVDKQLINLLYNEKLKKEMPIGEVLTTVYSELSQIPDKKEKRYVPRDISLEIRQDESPLVLKNPFLANAGKRFHYQRLKNGASSIDAIYGVIGSKSKFASLNHNRLSQGHIYRSQLTPSQLAKKYESMLGPITERSNGYVHQKLGNFKYVVADTVKFSCVITIKYFNAETNEIGGHEVLSGVYCNKISDPVNDQDVHAFINSIDVLDRSPIQIRERKVELKENRQQNFSALRLTGKWPTDNSFVAGLKLIIQGDSSGLIKVSVGDEICEGMLSKISSNGLGQWALNCETHESANGRYSWDTDGTFSFKGETIETLKAINWNGHQVF